jgi:hypothetical protein
MRKEMCLLLNIRLMPIPFMEYRGKGRRGAITWDISNNIEMKVKSTNDKDSLGFKKISLIDELGCYDVV